MRTMNGNATIRLPEFPNEIWSLVGEQVLNRRTLGVLCRVSRAFHAIFTSLLYEKCVLDIDSHCPNQRLSKFHLSPHLGQVKNFIINLDFHSFIRESSNNWKSFAENLSLVVSNPLQGMTTLQYFSISFNNMQYGYQSHWSPVVMFPRIAELKSRKTLRNISISFGDYLWDFSDDDNYLSRGGENPDVVVSPDRLAVQVDQLTLKGFHNLSSLELYQISVHTREKERGFVDDLAAVLLDCPRLTTLGLSISIFNSSQGNYSVGNWDFLAELSVKYAEIKGLPLKLKSIRFGWGRFLWKLPRGSSYLFKLIDLQDLESLWINNSQTRATSNDLEQAPPIDYDLICEESSPKLHRLSITELCTRLDDTLHPARVLLPTVRELIITGTVFIEDIFAELFNANLELSMLAYRCTDDPTDLCLGTLLDKLPDEGSHLVRLRMRLDFGLHWPKFQKQLSSMTRLTQLHLEPPGVKSGGGSYCKPVSNIEASSLDQQGLHHWPSLNEQKQISHEYATMICQFSPASLRYIMVGQHGWRVRKISAGTREEQEVSVVLEELDVGEISSIDLFLLELDSSWTHHGLHGSRRQYGEGTLAML